MAFIPKRIFELLKIRTTETGMVALVTGLMFLATGGAAVGSPGVEALFFSRVGVQFLPHMYIALGLVIVLTSLGITGLLGRVDRKRLYVFLPLVMGALLVGARLLTAFDFSWFYPPLWLGMNVFWSLLNLFIWGLAGMVCDTRQAKRLFPLFGAGGILGLTAGGLLTKPLVGWLGTENLLLVWAVTLVIAFFIAQMIIRTQATGKPAAGHRKVTPLLEGLKQGYQFARRSALLRWMAMAAVLFAVLYYAVVFPFSKGVAAEFPQEDDLTAFLGVFQGLSMGAAFLTSLLFSNRLYARFGFMSTILAYSLIYLLGFSALAIWAVFPVLVGFRFTQLLWSEGVSEGANQAMYNLAPPEQREQTRAFVRGVANPAGVSLVGVILLTSETLLPPDSMFIIGLLAAAVTTFMVWRARGAYGQALIEALRAGQAHLFFSEEEPFGGFRRDATAVAAVVEGISSPEVAVRRVSAEILGRLGVAEAVDAIVAALDDDDPAVRAALLRSLAQAGATAAMLEVVAALEDAEPEVRLEAVRALRQLSGYKPGLIRHLQPRLHDPDPGVRSQVAASLLSMGTHTEAEQVLRELAFSEDIPARVEALQALTEWGSQSAYDIAKEGLHDPHPAIRRTAASTLARVDAERCIYTLVGLLRDEDLSVRKAAAQGLGEAGQPAVEPVVAALSDPGLESGALLALEHLPLQGIRDQIETYAHTRVEKARHYHDLWLAAPENIGQDGSMRLLKDSLRDRSLDEGMRALKAIGLLGDRAGIGLAIENLNSRSADQRANALETLESLGDPDLVRPLIALWEPEEGEKAGPDALLVQVMQDEDPWLRACAALATNGTRNGQIEQQLTRLAESDPDELVRRTAKKKLFGESSMETLQTLSLMERILFLRRVPLFAELPPADLKQIAAIAGEHVHTDGEVISEQGEMGDEMFIIVSGEVRVVATSAGEAEEIVRRGPGEYVGEMSIISQEPRMASLIAAGEVRTLCIDQAEFEEILRSRPETSLAVIRVLCDRLRERDLEQVEGEHA